MGASPDTVEPSDIPRLINAINTSEKLELWGAKTIGFNPGKAFSYRIKPMVEHPNGMRFEALDAKGAVISTERYVSIGGGFIRSEEHTSELQSLMRISYAVFCLKKKNKSQLR